MLVRVSGAVGEVAIAAWDRARKIRGSCGEGTLNPVWLLLVKE